MSDSGTTNSLELDPQGEKMAALLSLSCQAYAGRLSMRSRIAPGGSSTCSVNGHWVARV